MVSSKKLERKITICDCGGEFQSGKCVLLMIVKLRISMSILIRRSILKMSGVDRPLPDPVDPEQLCHFSCRLIRNETSLSSIAPKVTVISSTTSSASHIGNEHLLIVP